MKNLCFAVILAGILMSMFTTGCSGTETGNSGIRTSNDGTKDTIYIGGGSGKQIFNVGVYRNTEDETYSIYMECNSLYPFPKFIVNGIETTDNYYEGYAIECGMKGVRAGNLTYSVIWDNDTLTRTINLPNNTYTLEQNHTDTHYRYSVAGGNGDEKVVWHEYGEDKYIYKRDTLSVNEAFVLPKTSNYSQLNCQVMHKDTKSFGPGYTATAESKRIAVCEEISLWWFQIGSY